MGSRKRIIDESTCGNFSSQELIMGGYIPEWMLFEVFIRLPVKVLFRSKVVSKQWHSMISDPSFARMYVARTSLLPPPHSQQWILISCFARKPIVEQFFREKLPMCGCSLGMNCLDLLTLPHTTSIYEFRNILVGISNGLLLYGPVMEDPSEGRISSYAICNPITGQWITLPPHEHRFQLVFTGFVTQIKDNVLESYRVLRIYPNYKIDHRFYSRYEVYFSEIRKWACYIAYFNQKILSVQWENSAVIDRILHWIVEGHIMAFDLYNRPDSNRLISLPVDSVGGEGDETGGEYNFFDEHQGHLRYFKLLHGRRNKFSISLWKLIDYDAGEWHLQHRVIFDNFRCDCERSILPIPLSFHPFDSNIVYLVNKEGFLSYDIKTRELKTMDDLSEKYPVRNPYFWPYFLFVVPTWPVSMNSSPFEVTTKD